MILRSRFPQWDTVTATFLNSIFVNNFLLDAWCSISESVNHVSDQSSNVLWDLWYQNVILHVNWLVRMSCDARIQICIEILLPEPTIIYSRGNDCTKMKLIGKTFAKLHCFEHLSTVKKIVIFLFFPREKCSRTLPWFLISLKRILGSLCFLHTRWNHEWDDIWLLNTIKRRLLLSKAVSSDFFRFFNKTLSYRTKTSNTTENIPFWLLWYIWNEFARW